MADFLNAQWKNLVMANYVIDPGLLKPYLPYKTELDLYNGNVYLSLVGFLFSETKLLGMRIPWHINFEEVNLRFYVRFPDNGESKRGVVFIKEIVPRFAISLVANTIYRERYSTMQMSHHINETDIGIEFDYKWKYKNKWNSLMAITEKNALPLIGGSESHFITEHYWGYSKYNQGKTFEYEVQHPPWEIYPVKKYAIDCDFATVYGQKFSFLEGLKPVSVFVAKGSLIKVLNKRTI